MRRLAADESPAEGTTTEQAPAPRSGVAVDVEPAAA
jgi:hypothetical protein